MTSTEYVSIWPREKKAFAPKYATTVRDYRGIEWDLVVGLTAVFLALCFFATVVLHFPVAIAADHIDYRFVHTKAEACEYARENKGAISNWKEVKGNCV